MLTWSTAVMLAQALTGALTVCESGPSERVFREKFLAWYLVDIAGWPPQCWPTARLLASDEVGIDASWMTVEDLQAARHRPRWPPGSTLHHCALVATL